MGEEWTELVWTSISLVALSIVLVIAFNFMQLGKSLTNQVYQEQAVVADRQEVRNFLPYDRSTLTGSETFSAALDISSKGYFALIACAPANRSYEKTYAVIHNDSCDFSNSTYNASIRSQITDTYNDFTSSTCKTLISRAPSATYCVPASSGTAAEFQDAMDTVARTATRDSTKTFNDLSFKSHIIYNNANEPIGLYLIRLGSSGEVV